MVSSKSGASTTAPKSHTTTVKLAVYQKFLAVIMGAFHSKEPIKIWLPSHGAHFKFPHFVLSHLEEQIDGLLKDIEDSKKPLDPPSKCTHQCHLHLSEDDIPVAGGWVLVDLNDGCFLHKSVMRGLVVPGGKYAVLPLSSTGIQKEKLEFYKKEIEAAEDSMNGSTYTGSTVGT